MTMPVLKPSGVRVTLYMAEKVKGHSDRDDSSRVADERPKSSFTEASETPVVDSEDDFPRNSHFELRAKPCWGSLDVAS